MQGLWVGHGPWKDRTPQPAGTTVPALQEAPTPNSHPQRLSPLGSPGVKVSGLRGLDREPGSPALCGLQGQNVKRPTRAAHLYSPVLQSQGKRPGDPPSAPHEGPARHPQSLAPGGCGHQGPSLGAQDPVRVPVASQAGEPVPPGATQKLMQEGRAQAGQWGVGRITGFPCVQAREAAR